MKDSDIGNSDIMFLINKIAKSPPLRILILVKKSRMIAEREGRDEGSEMDFSHLSLDASVVE